MMVGADRDQRNVSRALHGGGKAPLVLGADTCLTPGLDLESVGNVTPKSVDVLVVDIVDVVDAKGAHLAAPEVAGPAAPAPTTSTAPSASWPGFLYAEECN